MGVHRHRPYRSVEVSGVHTAARGMHVARRGASSERLVASWHTYRDVHGCRL